MQIEAKITVYEHWVDGCKPPEPIPLSIKDGGTDRGMVNLSIAGHTIKVDASELRNAVQRIAQ